MLTAILFDDEKPALLMLEHHLHETGLMQVVGAYQTYDGFLDAVRDQKPDVAFLDIETPEKSGLAAARELQKVSPETDTVFVSACRQYALDAFDLNAVDYLLKPVQIGRLMRTVERLCERRRLRTGEALEPPSGFQLRCMGEFNLYDGENGFLHWPTQKTQELLAFLWRNRGRTVGTSVLTETLWPELDNVRARNNLYTTIYNLKKELGRFVGEEVAISKSSGGYQLFTTLKSDAECIEELLKTVGQGEFEEDLRRYRQAMSLYTGNLFGAEDYAWAHGAQAFLLELFQKHGMRLANRLLGKNRWREAQEILQYLLLRDPCCEGAYILLIRTHAVAGDVAETRQCYMRYCKMMQNEFAVTPRELDEILGKAGASARNVHKPLDA